MVFSFVLFIGFIFFVLIFVKPYSNDFLTGSVVSGAQYNFMEAAKVDVITFFVSLNDFDMGVKTCFKVDLPSELIGDSSDNSIVRFVDGSVTNSEFDNNVLSSVGSSGESYYVFLSNEFVDDTGLIDCFDVEEDLNVNFGSFREEKIISVKRLGEMKVLYDTDYDSFRQSLAIPDVFDFAVVSDVVKMEKDIPSASEVFAEDYVEKVLFDDGEVKFVRFSVKLWR